MHYFFFRELQLITVLLLIRNSYLSQSARFVSLKVCERFSIFDSVSFLLRSLFLFNRKYGLFDSFQIKNDRKAEHTFAP